MTLAALKAGEGGGAVYPLLQFKDFKRFKKKNLG